VARWVGIATALLSVGLAAGCMTAISFDELGDFGFVGTRQWVTSTYFIDGVEHDSHTFVVSGRGDYCERVEEFRAERGPLATGYWMWVGQNVGWDVEQGQSLGDGEVAIPDPDARRQEWLDRTRSYLAEASDLWVEHFEGPANVAYLQFHRGRRYAAGDRAEHDSPLAPAADGEGEVAVGGHPVSAEIGTWQWSGAVGFDADDPYAATAAALDSLDPGEFRGLGRHWAPDGVGDWYRASGGTAVTSRDSVHSWDMELSDGTLVDAAGESAGGFRMFGNYYRCFLDYVEMEPGELWAE